MSRDRTRTRDRSGGTDDEFATEFEIGEEGQSVSEGSEAESEGLQTRVSGRARALFSPRSFLIALLLTMVGLFATSTLVPVPGAGLLGVFVATFLFGLVIKKRRYAETVLAGGVAAAASTLLDLAVVAFLGGFGISIAVLAGALGGIVGGLGTYFGRDLREGLTRDL